MKNIPIHLLFFSLILVFLLEGSGILFGRETSYYVLLLTPLALFASDFRSRNLYFYPKKITLLILILFGFGILSLIFSVNKQLAIEGSLAILALFLIAIYVYQHQDEIKKLIPQVLIALGIIFGFLSLAFTLFSPYPIVSNFQYVTPLSNFHSHIGNLLVLSMISCFFVLRKNSINKPKKVFLLILIGFFLMLTLLSYSRTAYLTCIPALITLFIICKDSLTRIVLVVATTLLLGLLIVVGSSSPLHDFLVKNFSLPSNKDSSEIHTEYINQGISTIKLFPLTGVGTDNFLYGSKLTTNNLNMTTSTAHNIFIDVIAENGIFAGLFFALIILLLFKNSNKNFYYLLLFTAFLNFQTDFTHKFYSFLFLFAILAGVNYKEKLQIGLIRPMYISIFVGLVAIAMLVSIFVNGYSFIDKRQYENTPEKSFYLLLFRDASSLEFLGREYEKDGLINKSLYYYQQSALTDIKRNPTLLIKIYNLKKDFEGKEAANMYAESIVKRINSLKEPYYMPANLKSVYLWLCKKQTTSCISL